MSAFGRTVAKLSCFAVLLIAAAPLRAQTPVVFGDTITDPGIYFLAGNQSGTGTGIRITSDDVVLLLTRFTLRGDGSRSGIEFEFRRNVQIYGGRITNFFVGIQAGASEDCTVQGTRIDHCNSDGIRADEVDNSWFVRVRCDQNDGDGIEARNGDHNRFISVLSHDNGDNGILLGRRVTMAGEAVGFDDLGSDGNRVKLCWLAYNDANGLDVRDSDDNQVERNQCVGNLDAGIRLHAQAVDPLGAAGPTPDGPGPDGNFLRSNWCVFNGFGIVVEEGAVDNTLTNNTALANVDPDVIDLNPTPCDNTWFLNFYLIKSGEGADCIF